MGASWFDATSTALVSPLGDLRSAIAVERNVVLFLTLFRLPEQLLCVNVTFTQYLFSEIDTFDWISDLIEGRLLRP